MTISAISRFVLAHKALIAGTWLVLTILAIVVMPWSLGNLSEEITIPDTESATVAMSAYQHFGNDGTMAPLVLVAELPDGMAAALRWLRTTTPGGAMAWPC